MSSARKRSAQKRASDATAHSNAMAGLAHVHAMKMQVFAEGAAAKLKQEREAWIADIAEVLQALLLAHGDDMNNGARDAVVAAFHQLKERVTTHRLEHK